jgi:hypothetical protein
MAATTGSGHGGGGMMKTRAAVLHNQFWMMAFRF